MPYIKNTRHAGHVFYHITILTTIVELKEKLNGLQKQKQGTDKICARSEILCSNSVRTFCNKLSVPSSKVLDFFTLENGIFENKTFVIRFEFSEWG
jgi:hypothetical protein